jgi:hypothetical protein
MRLFKINLKMNTMRFILVHAISRSNNHTSSIVVLCCEKLVAPDKLRAVTYIVQRTDL